MTDEYPKMIYDDKMKKIYLQLYDPKRKPKKHFLSFSYGSKDDDSSVYIFADMAKNDEIIGIEILLPRNYNINKQEDESNH